MARLHQILAVDAADRAKSKSALDKCYHVIQKPGLFAGQRRTYRPIKDDDVRLPEERQRVQVTAERLLSEVRTHVGREYDTTFRRDVGNTKALADVVVSGKTLIKNAPGTFLLGLEKRLGDIATFIDKLPVRDTAEDWTYVPSSGLAVSQPIETTRTKKEQKPLVKYPATEQHPAQTELIVEDIVAGYWKTVKESGALSAAQRAAMLEAVREVHRAVKLAREEANQAEVPDPQPIGEAIFGYIFDRGLAAGRNDSEVNSSS